MLTYIWNENDRSLSREKMVDDACEIVRPKLGSNSNSLVPRVLRYISKKNFFLRETLTCSARTFRIESFSAKRTKEFVRFFLEEKLVAAFGRIVVCTTVKIRLNQHLTFWRDKKKQDRPWFEYRTSVSGGWWKPSRRSNLSENGWCHYVFQII